MIEADETEKPTVLGQPVHSLLHGRHPAMPRSPLEHIRGDDLINVEAYLEIADLFRFRWDPAILGVLAERPHRFRELHKRLARHIDDHLDDNAVDRGLKRLTRHKHVAKSMTRIGRREVPIYAITPEGTFHLRVYAAFIETYQRMNMSNDNPTTDRRHAS